MAINDRLKWIENKHERNIRVTREDVGWLLREYRDLANRQRDLLDEIDRNRERANSTYRGRLFSWMLRNWA